MAGGGERGVEINWSWQSLADVVFSYFVLRKLVVLMVIMSGCCYA